MWMIIALPQWCKKQIVIAYSNTKAKYHSLAFVAIEVLWIQTLLSELGIIHYSIITLTHNLVLHAHTKHMEFSTNTLFSMFLPYTNVLISSPRYFFPSDSLQFAPSSKWVILSHHSPLDLAGNKCIFLSLLLRSQNPCLIKNENLSINNYVVLFGIFETDVSTLWENIESVYASNCGNNKLSLLNSIVSLKFNKGTSLSDPLNEFQGILDQISGMNIKFEDKILGLLLLNSLLES
ncbi:hypothetical protein CR513_40485, partial [Mucuna pruriens]